MCEDEIELTLVDIFDDVSISTIKQVVTINVGYLLERKVTSERYMKGMDCNFKLQFPKGFSIVFPEGSYEIELEETTEPDISYFEGDFEVFAEDHNTVILEGHAYGTVQAEELVDITVWFKTEDIKPFIVKA